MLDLNRLLPSIVLECIITKESYNSIDLIFSIFGKKILDVDFNSNLALLYLVQNLTSYNFNNKHYASIV